ncbi:SpoIIE family protein phosphatase [Streptomyces sp. NBC_01408]|uniref:SpoIIE family protein phosphatase n=1 Tax=Streptomyces sp. NBC_01408 TaxID=2903855 RepID=UPI0022527024|nr:SpoIIE family protein phosphatase [Streptomyces sp. NBC_01408]MCX4695634.1 SpoIIE family protein phosphatase [Streptomyces sp. NBC_01408]
MMHDPEFHDAAGVLTEPGDDTYALLDVHGVLLGLSPGAERLLGYTAEEVQGRRAADLLSSPSDAAGLVGHCTPDAVVDLGPAVLRHRSGHGVEVTLQARPMISTAGDQQWLIRAADADMTRRQELGEALLRGLFTESPFLIDVFDRQLRFVAQNDAQRRTTGFAGTEFIGHTMAEVAPAGLLDMAAMEARQRRVLESGEAQIQTEVHGRTPDDPDREHVWSESILPLRSRSGGVIALAHAVADVTERARARERLAFASEASARIGGTLDVLRTAQELVDVAVPRFADHAYVNLLDPVFAGQEPLTGPVREEVPLRRAASSTVPDGPADAAVATGDVDPFTAGAGSLFTRVMTDGEPLLLTGEELIAELTPADPRRAGLVREFGVHSWLLVPMSARGAVLGAVVFVRFQRAHAFEPDDVLLAEEIVARAAVCIDNASRYTRERTTALALRRSLLPQELPELGAAETVSRYLPARGHAALGGAWFDVIPLSGARVALVVGEVPGQGLHSAVTMGRLRTAVRTLADLDLSPEELLTHLDDQVNRFQDEHGEGLAGRAAGTTCVYAVYDPVARTCVVARAGHAAPALASADGGVQVLDVPGGAPLGQGGAPFESAEFALDDGDLLLLYTEGLVTTQGGSRDAGLGRLREALSDARHGAAPSPSRSEPGLDDISDTVIARLLPAHPDDDVVLLAARVHGLDADRHASWELPSEAEVVSRARGLATRQLTDWGLEELEFTTELVVSELLTNAIRYGGPPIRLRLIRDRSLICEVQDGSSTSPHIRRALETDEGGRGLFMVAQFTQLWGTRYHDRGKTIWAEQPFPDGGAAAGLPGFPDFEEFADLGDLTDLGDLADTAE